MRYYSIPVRYTVFGYITVEASDTSDAERQAKEMQNTGFHLGDIQDRVDQTEVLIDQFAPMCEEDDELPQTD